MNQATHAILIAQATADVTHHLQSIMDFDSVRAEGHAFMAMAAGSLGLSEREGRKAYDNGFPELKQRVLEWAVKKAEAEVKASMGEAVKEQSIHAVRLRNLRESHDELLQRLAERHRTAVPEGADDDFMRLINSSHEEIMRKVERDHIDFMAIVRLKHQLILEHCFTGHLVSEETAKKLVDLYETK